MKSWSSIYKVLMAAAVALYASCTKVEYTGSELVPTDTFVRYSMDWAGQADVPSEMTVLMGRILNTIHFSCKMDSLGTMQSVLRDSLAVETDSLNGLHMPNGEYYIMAFNSKDSAFGLAGYDAFVSEKGASMRDIYITAPHLTESEVAEVTGGSNVSDFNPDFEYIKSITPAYLDVQKVNIHPDIDTAVTISPVPVSQTLTFRIDIISDPEVEIAEVKADISGVPDRVQLLTGHISDTLTHRVPFTLTPAEGQTYEGKICVLGLFPSVDATYTTGPGILQLAIRAKVGDSERTLRAGINLQQSIKDANLMVKASENERLYRIGAEKAVIDVQAKLKIEKDNVVTEGDSEGVEVWFKHEDIEFEI